MKEQKRVQLTPYASAKVDEDCSPETISALKRMVELVAISAVNVEKPSVHKSHNHHHFWIEDGMLFESYSTIRGMRYRATMEVPEMPNTEFCSEEIMDQIAEKYLPVDKS